jgi:uncharacterized protein (DUF4415 family)
MNKLSETNLELFDALTDEMIDTSDIPPLSDEFFEKATWRMPKSPMNVVIKVEPEILEWFKAQGDEWERRLTAALRIYVEAHKDLVR